MEKIENNKKSNKHIVLIAVLLIFFLGLSYLIVKRIMLKEVVDYKPIPAVDVSYVRKGNINKTISLMGSILPSDTYYISAKLGGDIKEIYVKNGDYVKKGDPICKIDASKEEEAAFIQYDTARNAFERMSKLYMSGDISKANYESVKAQYDAAKLKYETILEYSVPVAVGNGVVESTDMIINTSIKSEKLLCLITSDEAKEINFGVTERILKGIKIGDKVTVEKNGEEYDAYVSNIGNLIDTKTGLFNIKATIISDNSFASGIIAKANLVYDRRTNVDVLPYDYVSFENGNAYIYIVNEKNIIEKKYIDTGISDEVNCEILTNIPKDMKIVSTWSNDLIDGIEVKIEKDEKIDDVENINEITETVFNEQEYVKDEMTIENIDNDVNDGKNNIINISTMSDAILDQEFTEDLKEAE